MRFVVWSVGRSNLLLAPFLTILTLLVTHICCWGPVLLVPLGLGGITQMVGANPFLQPLFYLLALFTLSIMGWKTYRNPRAGRIEKLTIWLSALVIITMIVTGR